MPVQRGFDIDVPDGKKFTYVNQLASSDADLSKREDWFTCVCCPPNVLRLLGSIGGYAWKSHVEEAAADVVVNLYLSSTLRLSVGKQDVRILQETDWPWSGDVKIIVQNAPSIRLTMMLRIPGWSKAYKVSQGPALRVCSADLCPIA